MTVQISRLVLKQYSGVTALMVLLSMRFKKNLENAKICLFFFLQGAELWYCNYIFTVLLYFYFVPHLCMFSTSGAVHAVTLRGQCSQKLKQDTITRQEEDVMRIIWRYFAQHPKEMFPLLFLFSGVNHDSEQSPLVDVKCQHR